MVSIGPGMIGGDFFGERVGHRFRFPPFWPSSGSFLLIVHVCRPTPRLSDLARLHSAVAYSELRAADARWIILIPVRGFPMGCTLSGTRVLKLVSWFDVDLRSKQDLLILNYGVEPAAWRTSERLLLEKVLNF